MNSILTDLEFPSREEILNRLSRTLTQENLMQLASIEEKITTNFLMT